MKNKYKLANPLAQFEERNPTYKKHKPLRGIRCYASSLFSNKHRVKYGDSTEQRCLEIIDNLSKMGRDVALLSYYKSRHSEIIGCHGENRYFVTAVFQFKCVFSKGMSKQGLLNYLMLNADNFNDALTKDSVVYIGGLNVEKMLKYIGDNCYSHKFSLLANNCSRYAANVLLAGIDRKPARFIHDRTCQMPANTIELAKEIDNYLRRDRFISPEARY